MSKKKRGRILFCPPLHPPHSPVPEHQPGHPPSSYLARTCPTHPPTHWHNARADCAPHLGSGKVWGGGKRRFSGICAAEAKVVRNRSVPPRCAHPSFLQTPGEKSTHVNIWFVQFYILSISAHVLSEKSTRIIGAKRIRKQRGALLLTTKGKLLNAKSI